MNKSNLVVIIRGNKWIVRELTSKQFAKLHGYEEEEVDALVDFSTKKREIHFVKGKIDVKIIKHELFHAFMRESLTSSADLSPDQVEEVGADIIAEHLFDILKLTEEILEHFAK